jgi:hypothetical protein
MGKRDDALTRLQAVSGCEHFRPPTSAELTDFIEYCAADVPLGDCYRWAVDPRIPEGLARMAAWHCYQRRDVRRMVQERREEMRDERAADVRRRLSREGLTEWLARLAEKTEEGGQPEKAVQAVRTIAQMEGLLTEKREHSGDLGLTIHVRDTFAHDPE